MIPAEDQRSNPFRSSWSGIIWQQQLIMDFRWRKEEELCKLFDLFWWTMMVEYMMHKKDHKYLILVKMLANPAAYFDVLLLVCGARLGCLTFHKYMWSASLSFFFGGGQKLFYLQYWEQCLKSVLQVASCLKSAILLKNTVACIEFNVKI